MTDEPTTIPSDEPMEIIIHTDDVHLSGQDALDYMAGLIMALDDDD